MDVGGKELRRRHQSKETSMTKGNFARNAGLVITTSIATAAIASSPLDNEFKFLLLGLTIILGAGLAAFAADIERGQA